MQAAQSPDKVGAYSSGNSEVFKGFQRYKSKNTLLFCTEFLIQEYYSVCNCMSTFEYRPGPAIRVTRLNYLGLYRSTVSVISSFGVTSVQRGWIQPDKVVQIT